jgi:hypothetical protein
MELNGIITPPSQQIAASILENTLSKLACMSLGLVEKFKKVLDFLFKMIIIVE